MAKFNICFGKAIMMKKYLKVVYGTETTSDKSQYMMGESNFCREEDVLKWLYHGSVLYDVNISIPDAAQHNDMGLYSSNDIELINPRPINDELVLGLYNKNKLSNSEIAQALLTLLWSNRAEIVKYIIKDRVNLSNVNEFVDVFETSLLIDDSSYNTLSESEKEIYDILKEIQSPLDLSLYVDKEIYIREISDDPIINLTGQSGSGKSTYAKKHFNTDEYLIIDTDEIFSENIFPRATGINRELGIYFRKKYKELPDCGNNFDTIYKDILEYCKKFSKTIVIDCALFHCVKDVGVLKGKMIIIRTCIDNCYERLIERYKKLNPNYNEDGLNTYKERKKRIYKWYKYSNIFINNIDTFITNKERHLKQIRDRLVNTDFSLFTNNCLGGFIYHDLGLKFLSPTINLRIKPKEFIAFVSDLNYYLSQDVVELLDDNKSFPVGIISGNSNHIPVTINFEHYLTFDEAIKKWNDRKKRVNYDNIYVMMEYYDGIHNEGLITAFEKVPYINKMILTHKDHKEYFTTAIHCFDNNLNMSEIGGKIFRYDGLSGKRYYDEFDYVDFFNKK